MDVTLELVHWIPSQPSPQGSDPFQFGGLFSQNSVRDVKAITAVVQYK